MSYSQGDCPCCLNSTSVSQVALYADRALFHFPPFSHQMSSKSSEDADSKPGNYCHVARAFGGHSIPFQNYTIKLSYMLTECVLV